MRINEVYGHEPITPCQMGGCPPDPCEKVGTQCVDISAAVTLTPEVTVGTVTVTCEGAPRVTCETNGNGASCTLRLVQQVCVSVPVTYGVTMAAGETAIVCAEGCCAVG